MQSFVLPPRNAACVGKKGGMWWANVVANLL